MSTATVGAVVLGGDYQGLGIVRSLGRRGIPVCVIDDEPSVARHSRYASHTERVPGLFAEDEVLAHTLDVGKRLGLEGWVLYPTRDEIVAALSQRRDELERFFRVPTPRWDSVSWAWDKRRTYELAGELGVSAPRTWSFRNPAELETVAQHLPLVIKPAIKEHFVYVTNVKAWRADTPEQLETLFRRAAAIVPAEEVMVQELIPGDGSRQFSYCGFFKEVVASPRWPCADGDSGRSTSAAPARSPRPSISRSWRK